MNGPVISRQSIAEDADRAAQFYAAGGPKPANPHPERTEAHACWKAAFERYLLLHSAPTADGGA